MLVAFLCFVMITRRNVPLIILTLSGSSFLNLLFILVPPPPFPTLFPYTTLFRSLPRSRRPDDRHELAPPHVDVDADVRRGELDRKSTRLNSSHVSISYAVFCLKKKSHTAYFDFERIEALKPAIEACGISTLSQSP